MQFMCIGKVIPDYLANRGVIVHQEMMMVNQVLNPSVLFCEVNHPMLCVIKQRVCGQLVFVVSV